MRVTSKFKQRMIGFAVLTFLALIILPWILGKNQTAIFEEKKINHNQEKFVENDFPESIKIESSQVKPTPDNLDNHSKFTEEEPADFPQPNFPSNDSLQSSLHKNDTSANKLVNPAQITHIEDAIVHTKLDAKSATSIKTKQPDIELNKPNFNNIKLAKLHTIAKKSTPIEKNWTVQLGSFSNKVNAEKLVKLLKTKGYSAYVKSTGSGKELITRVFVGHEAEHRNAEMLVHKIEKSLNIHGVIVKINL